jgi:hypothetical protein
MNKQDRAHWFRESLATLLVMAVIGWLLAGMPGVVS